uniref:Peptidase_M13 domain-containing protein n=1 Tax=Strongyloides papillosus TaxID=174720 RepID=A0A0N5B6V8_STREA
MNGFILILYSYAFFSVSSQVSRLEIEEALLRNVTASRSLLEYLDLDVNPCDNFYKFSCGEWIKFYQKIFGSQKNITIRNGIIKFDIFLEEFEEGKLNNQSKAINNIYNLRRQCNELPEAKIAKCQSEISKFGKYALGVVFINNIRLRSLKTDEYNKIEDMAARIKDEFKLLIDEKKDIFDEEARNNFLFKLDKMKFKKDIYLQDSSYVEFMEFCYKIILKKFESKPIQYVLDFSRNLGKNTLKGDDKWNRCIKTLLRADKYIGSNVYPNAYYYSKENSFSINADSLNEPSFSLYYPMSLNYGYVGATIGHEITHAFDNENYNRTLKGDNKNEFNVTQMSVKNWEEKIKCFVEQYGMQKESITNIKINGILTLSENIADNGGLKLAHRAYMKWLQNNGGEDIEVPGFEKFTNEQLLFISFGRKFCEYSSKDRLEEQIKTDEHTPSEIRTNVALSNYKPFSDAFNCPVNSKMNPEDKCELWKIQNQF